MDFLSTLLRTVKPESVAAAGISPASVRLVEEALRANGFGRLVELKEGESARGRIDMFLCAAGQEARLRQALPQISPHGLIVLHDLGAAQAMEREGLLAAVALPTSQPFVLAQKRPQRG